MKIKRFAAAAVLCLSSMAMLTGCPDPNTVHRDSRTNTSYLYQFTANCTGGGCASGHTNKMVLTKATCQSAVVSVSDFYIDVDGTNYRIGTGSGCTWSGTPKAGGYTGVSNLYWQVGSCKSSFDGLIYWDSLDFDGDRYYEGNATFYY